MSLVEEPAAPNRAGPGPPGDAAADAFRRAWNESPIGRGASRLGGDGWLEVLLAVLIAASSFLAALPALYAYRVVWAPGVVAGAAAGSTAIAFLTARVLRLTAGASYLLSVLGLVLLLSVADGPHPHSVVAALGRGPSRILTETLPLSGGRASISPLVVLVWVCGAATAESLIRTAARRRAAAPTALVLPVGLYVLCYALASSAPGRDRVGGVVLLVTVAAAAAVRLQITTPVEEDSDTEVRPPSRVRTAFTGVVAAGVAAAVLAAVAPSVPALRGRPANLRRQPPTVTPVITDPVDAMAQLRDSSPRALPTEDLSVTLSSESTGYLAMAELDDYDGGQWRFSATFQPTGGRIPPPGQPVSLLSQPPVTQRIVIKHALPIPLLPALDRPIEVSGMQAVTDRATGMFLGTGSPGDPAYTVVSGAPKVTLLGLAPADAIDQTLGAGDVAIPPDTTTDLATTMKFISTLTGGIRPAASLAFMQDAVQALQTKEQRLDPTAPPTTTSPASTPAGSGSHAPPTTTTLEPPAPEGTSLSEVINAVTVNRVATPEQFATLMAMVARYLGVPARVVTGFRLVDSPSGQPIGAGTYDITNRQAWAWVEIPVVGYGWVICDPTPAVATAAVKAPPQSVSAPSTTLPPRQANAVPRNQIVGGHPLAPPGHISVPHRHPTSPWLVVGLTLAGLLILVLAGGPGQAALRRARRRRYRRAAEPGARAVGAWLELLDGLDRAGMRPAEGATATEVAQEIGHHFGAEYVDQAWAVADVADRAVFSTAVPVAAEEAGRAWEVSKEVQRRVLATLDMRQRLRSALVVGSAPIRPSGSARE